MNCGLDFLYADSADGPAVFIMLIVGFVVVGLALLVEFNFIRRTGCTPCSGCP
jgi:uncharacterized protein (DUF983 family)